jgi:hypothetical protein
MAHNAPNAWSTVKESTNKRRELKRFQEGVATIVGQTRSYFGLQFKDGLSERVKIKARRMSL